MLLHPDRNYNDVENATQRFAEVQSAYEVLSDPQERAWYDSHREAILRGVSNDDVHDHTPEFNNIKLTSTEDILSLIRRFNATIPFTDEPTGFFGIAAETFSHLADEEAAAGEYDMDDRPDYPPFGESSDSYDPIVKAFYAGWAGFSTRKTFAWKDKYRLSDAPDRRIRRLMEKENKKLREDAVRDFNDAVRFLVTFVRKRDPRYLPNHQTNAERQAALRDAAAAQAARSRAANQEKFNEEAIPVWAQPRSYEEQGAGHFSESEEESEVEHIECVVCDKIFKSEKSYEAHEKSKKHLKAVQQLRRQMRTEGAQLDLDTPDTAATPETYTAGGDAHLAHDPPLASDDGHEPRARAKDSRDCNGNDEGEHLVQSGGSPGLSGGDDDDDDDDNDEYAARATVEQHMATSNSEDELFSDSQVHNLQGLSLDGQASESLAPPQRKIGKAKEKRAKKAAREATSDLQGVGASPLQQHMMYSPGRANLPATDCMRCLQEHVSLQNEAVQSHPGNGSCGDQSRLANSQE